MYASVARKTIRGGTLGISEAITPLQALRTYTTIAARHAFMEDKIGSLEPCKYADLVVWSRNHLAVGVEQIKDLEIEMTARATVKEGELGFTLGFFGRNFGYHQGWMAVFG